MTYVGWRRGLDKSTPIDHDLSGGQLPRPGSEDNLEEIEKDLFLSKEMIRYTLFSLSFFFFFNTASNNIGISCSSAFGCQALDSHSYTVSSSLHRCSFFFFFFVLFVCLFFLFFSSFFFSLLFFFLILFCVLTLHFLILSSAFLFFYLLLLLTIFFFFFFLSLFFLFFFFLVCFFFFFFFFCVLAFPFLTLFSASLYFELLLLPTIFFFMLMRLSFIPQNKPVSITLFTHDLLSYLVYHSVLRTSLFFFFFIYIQQAFSLVWLLNLRNI